MARRKKRLGGRGIAAAALGAALVTLTVGYTLPHRDTAMYGVPTPTQSPELETVSSLTDLRNTRIRTVTRAIDGRAPSEAQIIFAPKATAPTGLPTTGVGLPAVVPVDPDLKLGGAQLPTLAPGEVAPGEDTTELTNPSSLPTISVKKVDLKVGDLLSKPIEAPITSRFGMRFHPILRVNKLHTGTDFGAGCGTPIGAARAGKVVFAGLAGGYGGRVVVDHGQIVGHHVETSYSHMSAIGVTVGQEVDVHDGIGLVGTTGFSTGCHLHFEVIVDGNFTDPEPWLDGRPVIVVPINGKPMVVSIPPASSSTTTPSSTPSTTPSSSPQGTPSTTVSTTPGVPPVVSTGSPSESAKPSGSASPTTRGSGTPSGMPSKTPLTAASSSKKTVSFAETAIKGPSKDIPGPSKNIPGPSKNTTATGKTSGK